MADEHERLHAALAGRYEVVREVGRGGMATVYLARDLRHEREVAVKVLRPDLAAALGPERFLREVKIAAALQHPHILPVHDSGEADGLLYYVMPYVEGESLREHLRGHGEMPIPDAVRVLRDVADALAAAHARGVVHRDIKPDNVLLSGRHALVSDFGVAKAVTDAADGNTLTATGVALGTPAYMAPEQATAGHVDRRADIYAFGVLAYEMLTGHLPFEGATAQALLAAHVADEAPSVASARTTVPPALDALVMKCLAKRAADRWQSAEELLPVLENVSTPAAGVTPTEAPASTRRTRRGKAAVVGGAMLIVIALASYVAWRVFQPASTANARVAVMRFENRTGIDSLDTFGLILAGAITSDLDRSGVVEAVPRITMDGVVNAADQAGVVLTPQVIRAETHAGLVVSGSYYVQAGLLAVRAEIVDVASDRAAAAVEPVRVPTADAAAATDSVRQRVLVALSALTNPELLEDAGTSALSKDLPASFEAYGKYLEGWEQWAAQDFPEALRLFREAEQIDSSSIAVRLAVARAAWGVTHQPAPTDSLLRQLEPRRGEMTPGDRAEYDWLRAFTDGDREGVRRASRQLSPLIAAPSAYDANHWDEARAYLAEVGDLTQRANLFYWGYVTRVAHWFGEHQRELDEARRGQEAFGHDPEFLGFEIRALAALGRADELWERLVALHAEVPSSRWFWLAARELLVHDHPALADSVGRRAVAWYRAELKTDSSVALRQSLASALFDLGEVDEARSLLQPMSAGDRARYADLPTLGYLGVIAARSGDTAGAEAYIDTLGSVSVLYTYGYPVYWQGVIAANLGECERAVAHLAEAYRQGTQFSRLVDGRDTPDALLTPIARCPAFRRFVKPKK